MNHDNVTTDDIETNDNLLKSNMTDDQASFNLDLNYNDTLDSDFNMTLDKQSNQSSLCGDTNHLISWTNCSAASKYLQEYCEVPSNRNRDMMGDTDNAFYQLHNHDERSVVEESSTTDLQPKQCCSTLDAVNVVRIILGSMKDDGGNEDVRLIQMKKKGKGWQLRLDDNQIDLEVRDMNTLLGSRSKKSLKVISIK